MRHRTLPWIGPGDPFPLVETAMRRPNGLLAAGGDLSVARLLDAYMHGIFPWFNEGEPLLWWSPDPRMVLEPRQLHVSKSLRKRIRANAFDVRADTDFVGVMSACGQIRQDAEGTWISPEMIDAYAELHRRGFAHSVEAWVNGELVGGLYGVAIGRMFFGESMFARRPDASKVALAHLARQLDIWGFEIIDCQMSTAHLASLGAHEIPRAEFVRRLEALVAQPPVPSPWHFDEYN
jgi:leucyl/phenylalanyl-tRNA---protein transferase